MAAVDTSNEKVNDAPLPNGVDTSPKKTAPSDVDAGAKSDFGDLAARISALETKACLPIAIPTEPEKRDPYLTSGGSQSEQRSRMKRALEDQLQLYKSQEDLEREVSQLKFEKDEYSLKERLWEQEQIKREQRQRRRKGLPDPEVPIQQGEDITIAHCKVHRDR